MAREILDFKTKGKIVLKKTRYGPALFNKNISHIINFWCHIRKCKQVRLILVMLFNLIYPKFQLVVNIKTDIWCTSYFVTSQFALAELKNHRWFQ